MACLILLTLGIGLGVGLGVGLGARNSGSPSPPPPTPQPSPVPVAPAPQAVVPHVCYETLKAFAIQPSDQFFAANALVNALYYQAPTNLPGLYVAPRNVAEVQAVLQCATQNSIQVAVKSGGHSYAGWSSVPAPGILMDLSVAFTTMTQVQGTDVVKIQAGKLYEQIMLEIQALNASRIVLSGRCGFVGIGGFITGGGASPLSRQFGLAVDAVVSATVVSPDGMTVTSVSGSDDTFWAVRGAGWGGIGVVVDFTLRTAPAAPTYTYGAIPVVTAAQAGGAMTAAAAALKILGAGLAASPRWLSLDWRVTQAGAVTYWVFSTRNVTDTMAALGPLLPVPTPSLAGLKAYATYYDMIARNAQTKLIDMRLQNSPSLPFSLNANLSTAATVDALLAALSSAPSSCSLAGLPSGGAVSDVAPTATAFPWRYAEYFVEARCPVTSAAGVAGIEGLRTRLTETVLPTGYGVYSGLPSRDLQSFLSQYYGPNLPRLQSIAAPLLAKFNPLRNSQSYA